MFPLTNNLRATTLFKAFILNALAAAFIASFAIEIRIRLSDDTDNLYILLNEWIPGIPGIPGKQINKDVLYLITFIVSFVACLIVYNILYLLFMYGGGMIASRAKHPSYF